VRRAGKNCKKKISFLPQGAGRRVAFQAARKQRGKTFKTTAGERQESLGRKTPQSIKFEKRGLDRGRLLDNSKKEGRQKKTLKIGEGGGKAPFTSKKS